MRASTDADAKAQNVRFHGRSRRRVQSVRRVVLPKMEVLLTTDPGTPASLLTFEQRNAPHNSLPSGRTKHSKVAFVPAAFSDRQSNFDAHHHITLISKNCSPSRLLAKLRPALAHGSNSVRGHSSCLIGSPIALPMNDNGSGRPKCEHHISTCSSFS